MKLHLVDKDPDVVAALVAEFSAWPEVSVQCGNLLECAEHCVVSPANSQGFMDGGIDRAFVEFFGHEIQRRVSEAISHRPEGHLPIGASLVVKTGSPRIPYLILAPTMISPEFVSAENVERAFRAVLRIARQHPEVSGNIYSPGFGTGVGGVNALDAARAMASAFKAWKESV